VQFKDESGNLLTFLFGSDQQAGQLTREEEEKGKQSWIHHGKPETTETSEQRHSEASEEDKEQTVPVSKERLVESGQINKPEALSLIFENVSSGEGKQE